MSVGSSERHQYERNGTELSAIRILITDYYADNAWRVSQNEEAGARERQDELTAESD